MTTSGRAVVERGAHAVARSAGRSRRCAGRRSSARPGCLEPRTTACPRNPAPPVTITRRSRPERHHACASARGSRCAAGSSPASRRSASSMSRTSSSNVVARPPAEDALAPSTRRRRARRPRSGGSSARRFGRAAPSRARRARTRPRTSSRTECISPVAIDVVVRLVAAGASATSPRRTRRRSPSRAARRGCRGTACSAVPARIAAIAARHLARDERPAAARRLVVEQDAVAGVQPVRLAVLDGHPVREDLRDRVRAARVERRRLRLRRLGDLRRTSRCEPAW